MSYVKLNLKALLIALTTCFLSGTISSAEEVDLELVLAMDGSGSISDEEYRLQLQGTADAFMDPAIQSGITSGPIGKVAVAVMVWADANFLKITTGWHIVDSPEAATKFSNIVRNFRSRKYGVGGGGGTGIGSAIGEALLMIEDNQYNGLRRIIDISGDGEESKLSEEKLVDIGEAKLLAITKGVQINGLPILTKKFPRLDEYYQSEVITGKGAFIVVADGFDDFGRAILKKLDRELTHRTASIEIKENQKTASLKTQ